MMENLWRELRGALPKEDTWRACHVQPQVGSQGGGRYPLCCQERPWVGRVSNGQPLCAFAILWLHTLSLWVS